MTKEQSPYCWKSFLAMLQSCFYFLVNRIFSYKQNMVSAQNLFKIFFDRASARHSRSLGEGEKYFRYLYPVTVTASSNVSSCSQYSGDLNWCQSLLVSLDVKNLQQHNKGENKFWIFVLICEPLKQIFTSHFKMYDYKI